MKIDLNEIINTLRNEESDSLSNFSMLSDDMSSEISPSFFKETELELSDKPDMSSVIDNQANLENLKNYRKAPENISTFILESTDLKFNEEYSFLIKSIKKFSENVTVLELIDEFGLVEASCMKNLENMFNVNDILVINNFSVWRINKPHINIVEENIKNIIK